MNDSKTYPVNVKHKIMVIGVGNAGNHVVNRMIDRGTDQGIEQEQVEFIGIDTDRQTLNACKAPKHLLIGEGPSKDSGLEADPKIGEKAALASAGEISAALKGVDMVFVICGMGGMGSSVAPVVAKLARDMDILTVGLVTAPCSFEGDKRQAWAREGIENLRKHVNSLILYPGDKMLESEGRDASPQEVFREMDRMLFQAIKEIVDLICIPSIINLNFDDVAELMKTQGLVHVGLGEGQGMEMALDAVRMAVDGLMFEGFCEDASHILIQVSGDVNLVDVNEAITYIQKKLAVGQSKIIFGATHDDTAEGRCKVLVIAKFPARDKK